jgi:hypothetical protein
MPVSIKLRAALALLGANLACTHPAEVCPGTSRISVSLTVLDSVTLQRPAGETFALLIGSSSRDSVANEAVFSLGSGKIGDFNLVVRSVGYADWTRAVHVDGDNCGVPLTVQLTARLQRKS